MNIKYKWLVVILLGIQWAAAQSNTAVTSGGIGKCRTWDFPYTLYNTAGATQYINPGVTVNVNEHRSISAVVPGAGAMDLTSGSITLDTNGFQHGCRWEIPATGASYNLVNNNGVVPNGYNIGMDLGAFFGAPVINGNPNYYWYLGGGWSPSTYGGFYNGVLHVRPSNNPGAYRGFFSQNQGGPCGTSTSTPVMAPTWINPVGPFNLPAGQTLLYGASTGWANISSCYAGMRFTRGAGTVILDN